MHNSLIIKNSDKGFRFIEKVLVTVNGQSLQTTVDAAVDARLGVCFDKDEQMVVGVYPGADQDRFRQLFVENYQRLGYDETKLTFLLFDTVSDKILECLSSIDIDEKLKSFKKLIKKK